MVRDHPKVHKEPHHTHEIPLRKSLALLLKNPQVWLIAIFGMLMWLPIGAFAELWGVPYLMHTYSIDNEYASFATVMIFVGFAFGGPLAAWISERFKSRLFHYESIGFMSGYGFFGYRFWPPPFLYP